MASVARTVILCAVLHGYIAAAALIFQLFEYKQFEESQPNIRRLKAILTMEYNISSVDAVELIRQITEANLKDHRIEMSSSWKSFPTSLWFVMTLFTTVGTGHLVPQTFGGRLFCMLSALFGIPLYALFLKCAGEQIIHILRKLIEVFEVTMKRENPSQIKHMNIKVLTSAFLLMTSIILVGALGSFAFKWSYFEGVYFCFISLSTVGFGDLVPKVNDVQRKVFSIIYMFYNIVGLTVVASFISSLVNSMEEISEIWKSFKFEIRLAKTFGNNEKVDTAVSNERKTEQSEEAQENGQ